MRVSTYGSAFFGSDWLLKKIGGVGAQKLKIFALLCSTETERDRRKVTIEHPQENGVDL